MKKSIFMAGLACLLIAPTVMAGHFGLHQGNLADTDKIDIEWKQQYGSNCNTIYPVESINCTYISQKMGGVMAKYINLLHLMSLLTTENTFLLNISLSESSQDKGYAFDTDSCRNLQSKVKTGDIITVNTTGCTLQ